MNIIEKNKKLLIWLILLVLMCFSFTYQRVYVNPNFQCDSETLVSGVIRGEREGTYKSEYGLGRYYNIAGCMSNYSGESLLNDETTVEGYVIGSNILKLIKNAYTDIIKDAQYITFENGDSFVISEVSEKDNCYYFKVDSTYQIGLDRNGSLVNAKFFDENMNEYQKFFIDEYVSQYGLQGKVFSTIAKIINYHGWKKIELLLTVFLTASVLIAICYFVSLKYNCILSFCFYIVFLLSPWIRNFSSNLYWVEFTWFSPMLLGLIVSIFCINNKKLIIFGLFSFALIFIKSLCGYEYLSTIMLGLIMFPTSDLCISIFNKNKGKIKNDLKIIICLGLFGTVCFKKLKQFFTFFWSLLT